MSRPLAVLAGRACHGCGVPVTDVWIDSIGRRQRFLFCGTCKAATCAWCHYAAGRHNPTCARVRSQPCVGCGEELTPEDKHAGRRICPACRPDVVTVEQLEAVYLEARRSARQAIWRIVGAANVEDVIQDTMASLLATRATLTTLTPALFVFIVKRRAGAYLRSPWRAHFMPMSETGLLALEKDHAREALGHPARDVEVRLPERFVCRGCGSNTTPGAIDTRYCGECHEQTCPECRRYAGHSPDCRMGAG